MLSPAEIPSDLEVLAEIAMALVGFTGIVGALQTRSGTPLSHRDEFQIVVLLITSMSTVALCFVPSWISLIPSIDNNVWSWSMQILLVWHVSAWAIAIPFLRRAEIKFSELRSVEKAFVFIVMPIGALAVVLEILVVIGFFRPYSTFIFVGIMIHLVTAGMLNFLSLLLRPIGFTRQ